MNVVACITVRMSSERLPGKTLVDIEGKPALGRIVDRYRDVKGVSEIIVAVNGWEADQQVVDWCDGADVHCYQGEADRDVCTLIHDACEPFSPDYILRGLGDCTFIEPGLQDMMLDVVSLHKADAARVYSGPNSWPVYGAAESPYSWNAVERMCAESSGSQRTHFGTYMDENRDQFDMIYPVPSPGYNATYFRPYRLELDTDLDLELMRRIYRELGPEREPSLWEVVALLDKWPDLAAINQGVAERTGPLTTYTAAQRQRWAEQMEDRIVDWSGDWTWMCERTNGEKAIWCDAGKCYIGHASGPVLVLPDGTRIEGNAHVACSCGAGRTWHESKRRSGRK